MTHALTEPVDLPRRFCPACGEWVRGRFRSGPAGRADARCPHCRSMERQRFLAVLLGALELTQQPVGVVLDIAPAAITTRLLAGLRPRLHLRLDYGYDARDVDLFASITHIPLSEASVDLLVCYHVLEHVPDDRAAMREIARVLSPGGVAVVQVPIRFGQPTDEDPDAPEEERVRRFGQSDHVRFYGDDFADRLVEAGLVHHLVTPRSLIGAGTATLFGLVPDEPVWILRRAGAESPRPYEVRPTGLNLALDAIAEAWELDRDGYEHYRDQVGRLRRRTERQRRRIAALEAELAGGRDRTLLARVRGRLAAKP